MTYGIVDVRKFSTQCGIHETKDESLGSQGTARGQFVGLGRLARIMTLFSFLTSVHWALVLREYLLVYEPFLLSSVNK